MQIHYEEILKNLSTCIFEIDKEGTYTYCSDTLSKLSGYSNSEIVGKSIFDFMNKEEAKRIKNIFDLHLLNKEPIVDYESVYIHKGDYEITVLTNAIPILDTNGDVISFQGVAKDISEKKKLLKETNILEERLELALRGSNDGVWDWNIVDNSVYFSPRWKEMIGYSDEELPNEVPTWTERIHPDDVEATWASINEHVNSITEYYEGVHRLKHKDGHWVWILDRGKALYDTDGNAIRMIGTHTDISEEKAIQLKAKHQKQIIEQIHDSVISTDLKGVITSWNNASEILLGYSSDEIINKHISSIISDEDLESFNIAIDTLLKYGKNYVTVHLVTKSKEKLLIELSLSLLKDEHSVPIGIIGYSRDITEKKRTEDALAQQSRMAQMGEMISMIAHQWRQPLNSISLTASNLKLKFDFNEFDSNSQEDFTKCSQTVSEGLENIQEYIQTLSTTIDDFRNFYSPNKVSTSIKLEEIVAKSLKIISISLIEDNIELIQEYDSEEKIELHENEMMQVILTIFKNAQDQFLEKEIEKPSIKVLTNKKMISICDNAGGVRKDIISKIFDPYFSTKSEKNGTGLGLYMSKIIIEEHHKATLSVKNIDGGACFTIEFI
ncbi:MAG: PAS domain S-box protein [Sulfurimonas sp.]|nr:PAS domain S-box protein [Sulfurimonas sp.]